MYVIILENVPSVKTSHWCRRRCDLSQAKRRIVRAKKICLPSLKTVHSGLINFFSYHCTCLVIFVNLCPFSQSCSPCLPFPPTSYCLSVVEQLMEGKEKYQSLIKNWFMLSGRISSFLRYLKKFPWLIFGVNKRTETCIYNLCDALMSARANNLTIYYRKNQIMLVFRASVLLLTMYFVITFSK